ncbi:MAG: trimeric intracellular cation channel family protein [bacterium]|nr:trimeric intracellular cation channel family protein [bacterium]
MNTDGIIHALDLLGMAAFAFSGALRAMRRRPDFVGMTILAGATAIGGGLIRDTILGGGAAMLRTWHYPAVILASVAVTAMFPFRLTERETFFQYFDAFGLGVFSAIGATIAWRNDIGFLWMLFIAAISGAGGGVIRDVLLNKMPLVLYREIYITAVVIGAAAMWVGRRFLGMGELACFSIAMTITIVIRMAAIRRGWSLPRIGARGGPA